MAARSDFPSTDWQAVRAAAVARDTRGRDALEELCEAYWPPLYAFIRRQGAGAEEALDLTQGFFAQVLEKGWLKEVKPERGRFRAFLLASVKHYLSNQRDHDRARKRMPDRRLVSIDAEELEERLSLVSHRALDAEQLFERRWAQTLLERSLRRLERESAPAAESKARFAKLRGFLTSGEACTSYPQVAAELGLSEGAVKTAVYRLRLRFGEILREEVALTVVHPEEVDEELRHLLLALVP